MIEDLLWFLFGVLIGFRLPNFISDLKDSFQTDNKKKVE